MNNIRFTAFAVGASLFLGSPVYAQVSPASADDNQASHILEEITVTAERRESSLQATPIAMSAVTGDALEQQHVTDIASLTEQLPDVTFSRNNGNASVFIRGIGLDSLAPGSDSRVAIYTDGAYNPRVQSALGSFFDIERVEVLSGPQGTLYGRNATAGAINILSRDPGDALNGYVQLTGGDYNTVRTEGAVGGPVSDGVSARLAFETSDHSGYGKNIETGGQADDEQIRALRGKIKFEKNGLSATLISDFYLEDDHTGGEHYLGNPPGTVDFATTIGGILPANPRDVTGPGPQARIESYGETAAINYDLGGMTLSSLSAYKRLYSHFYTSDDMTTLGAQLLPVDVVESSESVSQEVRLVGKVGAVDMVVGGYYFHERNFAGEQAGINLAYFTDGAVDFLAQGLVNHGRQSTNAYAAFTQNTFHATDRLGIDFGARYSEELRQDTTINAFDLAVPYVRLPLFPPEPDDASLTGRRSWSSFDPKIGVHFQASPDVLLYVSYSTGFKSGGFNVETIQPPFNPEKITDIEGGIKADLLDRRLRVNLSAFDYQYKNLQLNVLENVSLLTENAARAKLYGAEVQLTALPIDDLELNSDAAYLHSEFESYLTKDPSGLYTTQPLPDGTLPNAQGQYSLAGNPLTYAPEWKLHERVSYTFHTSEINVIPRAELTYTSLVYYSAFKLPYDSQPAYTLTNLYLDFERPRSGLSAGLFVKNLSDRFYSVSSTFGSGFFGFPSEGFVGPPRTFGASITKRF